MDSVWIDGRVKKRHFKTVPLCGCDRKLHTRLEIIVVLEVKAQQAALDSLDGDDMLGTASVLKLAYAKHHHWRCMLALGTIQRVMLYLRREFKIAARTYTFQLRESSLHEPDHCPGLHLILRFHVAEGAIHRLVPAKW